MLTALVSRQLNVQLFAYPLAEFVRVPRGMTHDDSHAGYINQGIWGVNVVTTIAWEVILANLSFQLKHRQFPVRLGFSTGSKVRPRWTCRHRPSGLGPLSGIHASWANVCGAPWSDKQLKRQLAGQERGHPIFVDKVSNSSKPSTSKRFR